MPYHCSLALARPRLLSPLTMSCLDEITSSDCIFVQDIQQEEYFVLSMSPALFYNK